MLISSHKHSWAWHYDNSWTKMSTYWHYWALMSIYKHLRALMSTHENSLAHMSAQVCPWALMSMGPGHHECSWVLKSTHRTILLSAFECPKLLMRTSAYSKTCFNNEHKMVTFKMTSLWYFINISANISTNN